LINNILKNITIIIPTKNEETRLHNCLTAIKNLDYSSDLIEIIIIDNGSIDSTVEIAHSFGARVYIKPGLKVSGLRNVGATYSNGEVLCFVDADVIVSKGWLNAALKHLSAPDIGCITGIINIPQKATWVERTWALNRKVEKDFFEVKWASSMNMIISKDTFMKVGGFSESIVTGEDVEFSDRLRRSGYKNFFDIGVSVVHVGEAKTLKTFIKKERWRGYSDFDLLIANDFHVSNLRHAIQPLFFIFSIIALIISTFCSNVMLSVLFIVSIFFLPILKTILVLKKQKNTRNIPQLIIVWFVYYIARSIAIFDNIKDKIKNIFRK
jgi:glycosyltransferase involved in cell wall biosynthesis